MFKSIMLELTSRLNNEISNENKKKSIEMYAGEQLHIILRDMGDSELLPNEGIESQKEFENHILKIINICKERLLNKLKNEYN